MTQDHNEIFIRMDQITKNYQDPSSLASFQALRGIDLTIEKHSLTTIIGPSGAGKSTLLNILGGLVSPSTGKLFVDTIPLHDLDNKSLSAYRRNMVGFLWQLPHRNLLPGLSIRENIKQKMALTGYPSSKRNERIKELLEAVGLESREKHHLNKLSGGEAQRAGLAVALANEPRILLVDEPTGELDNATSDEIIRYLRNLVDDFGVTIVAVTHDRRFERRSHQTFEIIDGVIAGYSKIKRQDHNKEQLVDRFETNVKEDFIPVNQYGMMKIPKSILDKYRITDRVKIQEHPKCGGFCIHNDQEVVF